MVQNPSHTSWFWKGVLNVRQNNGMENNYLQDIYFKMIFLGTLKRLFYFLDNIDSNVICFRQKKVFTCLEQYLKILNKINNTKQIYK